MKIEQEVTDNFHVKKIDKESRLLLSHGFGDELIIDKQGAKQLIEVLKEFINEPN